MQTKKQSLIEIILDAFLGIIISVFSYLVLLPLFGVACSVSQSLGLTAYFVVISMVRRYITRRLFNRRAIKTQLSEA